MNPLANRHWRARADSPRAVLVEPFFPVAILAHGEKPASKSHRAGGAAQRRVGGVPGGTYGQAAEISPALKAERGRVQNCRIGHSNQVLVDRKSTRLNSSHL